MCALKTDASALESSLRSRRARTGGGHWKSRIQAGLATAIDLETHAIPRPCRSALHERKSRWHFREDYPDKDAAAATFNIVIRKGSDGNMVLSHEPIPPLRPDLAQIIEDQKS